MKIGSAAEFTGDKNVVRAIQCQIPKVGTTCIARAYNFCPTVIAGTRVLGKED